MKDALDILKRELQYLENGYNKFVINGGVNPENYVAKENRRKTNVIKKAIKKLSK